MLLVTHRLRLTPVGWIDLAELTALKEDPRVFAVMLGGVRTPLQVQQELVEDLALWGRLGVGIWSVRDHGGRFIGLAGIMERADRRGLSLRFAVRPGVRGQGLAREAASAALQDALYRARLARVIAVAREENYGSRTVLGGIGMCECERFRRDDFTMLVYETRRGPWRPGGDGAAGVQ